jgi:hypothetical protein
VQGVPGRNAIVLVHPVVVDADGAPFARVSMVSTMAMLSAVSMMAVMPMRFRWTCDKANAQDNGHRSYERAKILHHVILTMRACRRSGRRSQ